MQAMIAALDRSAQQQVLRVRLGREGLRDLASAGGYDQPVVAELIDAVGEVCGRAKRYSDPSASRYGPGLCWHIQLGGVLSSRTWAAVPMGCGSGDDPLSAYCAAIEDLRMQADRRASAAAKFAAFFDFVRCNHG
jgi:hypothetical protein